MVATAGDDWEHYPEGSYGTFEEPADSLDFFNGVFVLSAVDFIKAGDRNAMLFRLNEHLFLYSRLKGVKCVTGEGFDPPINVFAGCSVIGVRLKDDQHNLVILNDALTRETVLEFGFIEGKGVARFMPEAMAINRRAAMGPADPIPGRLAAMAIDETPSVTGIDFEALLRKGTRPPVPAKSDSPDWGQW